MYTGCETDRRVMRAATLEYRRVLFHRLCNGTRRPLELAAALLACGLFCCVLLFALVAYLLFDDTYAIARGSTRSPAPAPHPFTALQVVYDAAASLLQLSALLEYIDNAAVNVR